MKTEQHPPDTGGQPEASDLIIDAECYAAREEAARIVARAQAEAAAILGAAAAELESMRRKGYEEGYRRAIDESLQLLTSAKRIRTAYREEHARDIIRIALKAAGKIIGREIKQQPSTTASIVEQVLAAARSREQITVLVNPRDLEQVITARPRLIAMVGRAREFTIRGDVAVKRGGCIIETELGAINGELESQLNRLEETLTS
ncbi:hypothetical protein JW905_18850 [bacterium]|nr:hypothetical protein [candidate division CSSED10-310 bacterium]